jgi:hypothetical protein
MGYARTIVQPPAVTAYSFRAEVCAATLTARARLAAGCWRPKQQLRRDCKVLRMHQPVVFVSVCSGLVASVSQTHVTLMIIAISSTANTGRSEANVTAAHTNTRTHMRKRSWCSEVSTVSLRSHRGRVLWGVVCKLRHGHTAAGSSHWQHGSPMPKPSSVLPATPDRAHNRVRVVQNHPIQDNSETPMLSPALPPTDHV